MIESVAFLFRVPLPVGLSTAVVAPTTCSYLLVVCVGFGTRIWLGCVGFGTKSGVPMCRFWYWKTLPNHSDLWITPKTALRSALSRSAVAGRKKVSRRPRSSLLDALTGLLAELEAFLARRIGVVQLLARDEEPAQRPPEAPDGIFRFLVVLSDVGFRLCHGTSSLLHRKHPARVRSLLGDPGATPRDAVGRSWVQSRASRATGSIRPWRSCSSGPARRV